jgi:chemotaxis regulatin CheY-phosphate phosphatase CheZ
MFQNIVFPKGLLYNVKIEHYRTPFVNSAVGCIADLSKGLEEIKNGTSQIVSEKSRSVTPSRPNMNELREDTRDLTRIWDLYGHLLNRE